MKAFCIYLLQSLRNQLQFNKFDIYLRFYQAYPFVLAFY